MKKFIYVILLFSFLQITKVQARGLFGNDQTGFNLDAARSQAGLPPM